MTPKERLFTTMCDHIRQTATIMTGMSRRKEALYLLYQYAPEEVLENSPNFRIYIQRIGT